MSGIAEIKRLVHVTAPLRTGERHCVCKLHQCELECTDPELTREWFHAGSKWRSGAQPERGPAPAAELWQHCGSYAGEIF